MSAENLASPVERQASELACPVRLRRSSRDGLWHRFIETLILHRWQSFKNSPRGNTLIVRAALLIISVGLIVTAVGGAVGVKMCGTNGVAKELHEATFVLHMCGVLVGALAAVYWQMSRLYNRQWQHCNDVYTELLKASRDRLVRARLANALAQDLLVCDMWALRSFAKSFRDELEKAVNYAFQDEPGSLDGKLEEINTYKMTEDIADYYLSKYEDYLLSPTYELTVKAAEHGVTPDDRSPAVPARR